MLAFTPSIKLFGGETSIFLSGACVACGERCFLGVLACGANAFGLRRWFWH